MAKKYLDPKADLTFKRVFGEHKELLISFLNALLPLPQGKEIIDIQYRSPELVPISPDKKDTIVDVRCEDNHHRHFIVEMQMYWTNAFIKRALLNTCKAYSYPAGKGMLYDDLQPVYTLSLVNDIAFPQLKDFYHVYQLRHAKAQGYTIDDIQMVFIELPKFTPTSTSDKRLRCLWLRFLTEINEHTKAPDPELLADKNVSKAIELVEESAYNEEELYTIDKYWDAVSRERTVMAEKYGLGLAKGRAEGRAEGLAEGRAEGRAEGILLTAKNLKAMGLSTADIMRATGLTEQEIGRL